jgi:hypothetical protein
MTQFVVPNRPTYVSNVQNGLPAVRFTTAQMLQSVGTPTLGPAQTWLAAFRPLGSGNTFFLEHSVNTNTTDGSFLSGSNFDLMQIRRSGVARNIQDAIGQGITPFTIGAWQIATLVVRNTSTVASSDIYWNINGTNRATVFNTGSNILPDVSAARQLFLNSTLRVPGSNECGEILVYNRALTISEVAQVQNYLGYKWGIYDVMTPGIVVNGGSTQIATTTSLNLYKYEPFSYVYSGVGGQTVLLVSATTSVRALVVQSGSTVRFESIGGYTGIPSSTESIVLRTSPGNVTYTINVTINAGRFILPSETPASYTFYVNESVATTYGSDITFQTPETLESSIPISVPALPPGLSFSSEGNGASSSLWYLTGTPLVGSPATSYTIYGRGTTNTSFVISKTITIAIGTERISITASPSSNVPLTVDTPITNVQLTARYPSSFAGNLRYAWSFLPDGLRFVDANSNTVASPFSPSDSNSTMILTGTPTVTAAQTFRSLGSSNVITNVVATRLTSPNITGTQPLSFTFGETVLFDPVTVPTLYRNDPIDASSIVFRANTYFPSGSGMTSIVAGSLPTGLSLQHTSGDANAYLTGTPTVVSSALYNITATNSNGNSRTLSVPINVENDIITISGPNDVCYNFVISRPLVSNLAGYYPSNITYSATSSTGYPLTLSITNLSNTGISVDICGSTLRLGGIPDTITGLTTAVFTASNSLTGEFASCNLRYQVLTDDVTITNPTSKQTFFQNQEITPLQFAATTLSGRPVIGWSSTNVPDGLLLTSTGLLTGTPTNGSGGDQTFNVAASTGYVSETNAISYKTIEDDVLITTTAGSFAEVGPQFSNVQFDATTYSGISNAVIGLASIEPLQDPSITLSISNNTMSGDLTTADCILPYYNLRLDVSVGSQAVGQRYDLSILNANTQRHFYLDFRLTSIGTPPFSWSKGISRIYLTDKATYQASPSGGAPVVVPPTSTYTQVLTGGNVDFGYVSDIAVSSNTSTAIATIAGSMYRSTNNGSTWTLIPDSNISKVFGVAGATYPPLIYQDPIPQTIATDGNSNWLSIVYGEYPNNLGGPGIPVTIFRTSSDDGQTWTDVSSSAFTFGLGNSGLLYYNNGRYFIGNRRADASDVTTWTTMTDLSGGGGPYYAFNGDTGFTGTFYRTTNNGTTWSNVSAFPSNVTIAGLAVNGNYALATASKNSNSANHGQIYVSSNGLTFSNSYPAVDISSISFGPVQFDGGVYTAPMLTIDPITASNTWSTQSFLQSSPTSNTVGTFASGTAPVTNFPKRFFAKCIDNGAVSAIIGVSTTNTSVSFVEPLSNDYTFLQYTGGNIRFEAVPATPGFVYYYATGLPQGTRRVLDPSGIHMDISGIFTRYDSSYRQSIVYARAPASGNAVAAFPFTTRVLSPFVLKPQSGASGYTAFLRDYVNINAAQSGRDSVALPVQERPIGEFTSPGVGDVITQTVDPKCFSTSNCT